MAADGAKGGVLYPCLKSPPMLDFDAEGNCYVPQDGVDTMLVIEPKSGVRAAECPLPGERVDAADHRARSHRARRLGLDVAARLVQHAREDRPGQRPEADALRIWRPAVAQEGAADPPRLLGGRRPRRANRIYALASDLLDDEAVNAVVILLDVTWSTCVGRRIIPLPTQDCACHRVAFIDAQIPGRAMSSRSIAITELASSKLLQIKTRNIRDTSRLVETVSTDADGFEVRQYATAEDCEDAGRAV